MPARKFRVNLSEKDSNYLRDIAKELNLTESDVIRKGLKLMALYSKAESEGNELLIKKGDKEQPVVII